VIIKTGTLYQVATLGTQHTGFGGTGGFFESETASIFKTIRQVRRQTTEEQNRH
jgi:hypothetical protein